MGKKRGNRECSVTKLKDGRWEGKYTIGRDPYTGKVKRATVYGKTRQEASEKLNLLISQVQMGVFVEPNKVTVGQWLSKWMDIYQQPKISENFFRRKKDLIRIHIAPILGSVLLSKLRPSDIQSLYKKKLKDGKVDGSGGLAPQTVRHIHNILHASLKQAVKEGLVSRNVAADTTPPPVVKTRVVKVLNKQEISQLLEVIKPHRLYAAFITELCTAVRLGELLGMQWKDIDISGKTLKVRRQVNRVYHDDETSSLEYGPLKTLHSYRTIAISNIAVNELKLHKARQAQERLAAGQAYKHEDLVFCTALGGKIDPKNLYRIFIQSLKKAGLPATAFHNLRHSVATLLLQEGENIKTIQELLGHADAETTLNDYSHVLEEMKRGAADRIDAIFAEIIPPEEKQADQNDQLVK